MTLYSNSNALIPVLAGRDENTRTMYFWSLALLGTVLLAISSKISVDFLLVPATLQTLVLFTLAAAFGRNLAVATVLLYLAEGALGLPVFAKGGGIGYFFGPTAGYLAGFVIAAAIVGYAADRGYSRKPFKLFGFMLIGEIVILALGAAWLAVLFGTSKGLEYGVFGAKPLEIGVAAIAVQPFIVGDLIKIAIASMIVPASWQVIRRIKPGS